MIADIDATVARWMQRLAPDLDVVFSAPSDTPDVPERVVVTAFLHDVREDPDAGIPGWTSVRDEAGAVVGRQQPTRAYRFSYLLVATGPDTTHEHEALGRILSGSVLNEVVGEVDLAGQLPAAEGPVVVRCAPHSRSIDPHQLW